MNLEFTKTLRFKLTFWYSTLLVVIITIFVSVFLLAVNRYYQFEVQQIVSAIPNRAPLGVKYKDFTLEQRNVLIEVRQNDRNNIIYLVLILLIPLSGLSIVGGYLISGRMLKPLNDLNELISKINSENLNLKIDSPNSQDELSELIDNFNEMMDRLSESFELQKQFVENASHELKTPLAILQTNLDTLVYDKKVKKDELIEGIDVALDAVKFMNNLVEDLLELVVNGNNLEFSKIDLNTLIKEESEKLDLLLKQKEIDLDLELDKKFYIEGDTTYIRTLFVNLIENAIKYSDPKKNNKEIKIILDSKNRKIEIFDNGIGIKKSDVSKVFNKFYRVNKSRSRRTGGSGLGLAIVKQIADVHGVEIKIESVFGEYTKVILNF